MQKGSKSLMNQQRQKIAKGLKLIEDFKNNPKIVPFLQPQQIQRLGLYDFRFINRKCSKISIIQQKIKQNKFYDFQQLIQQLKLVFEMFSYYVPLNDPLQTDIQYFINQIDKWKSIINGNIIEQTNAQILKNNINVKNKELEKQSKLFSNKNQIHYESQRNQKRKNYAALEQQQEKIKKFTKEYKLPVRSTLAQKLQMVFFLKSHQTNEPFIHNIGDMYGIGKDSQDQYVIKLDNSTCCSWLEVLQNTQETQ